MTGGLAITRASLDSSQPTMSSLTLKSGAEERVDVRGVRDMTLEVVLKKKESDKKIAVTKNTRSQLLAPWARTKGYL